MQLTILTLAVLGLAALPPADARGSHHGGFGHRHTMSSGSHGGDNLASDQRHANDDYVKAAAEQEDKLLDTKIKSICHGC
ncbi:hypothetical protein [Bradyrhizobium sp. Tv2a-2]|uniref:hypothetical protein n=1 Tax=Bradyrhizobium sp. Tv2a-2 TaxID=113395 RepID=UPI0012EC04C4|nr:hypothetical protein [Bradyrhizobium sp. Tv2a-2]